MSKTVTARSTRRELGIAYREHSKGSYHTRIIDDGCKTVGRREFVGIRGGMLKSDANALATKYRRMGYLARVIKDPTSTWAHSVFVHKV